ncbi:hypothetical protein HCN44_007756 [Aphidius gifuensis]|uniref:Uncharacterized protein n=1 Tax=Aphidius gifuensis TaxID=684658 RepID=A0A834XMX0_APHGI|nr:hypothetical protein HCN44_007756 [Aphidius gifuensis]
MKNGLIRSCCKCPSKVAESLEPFNTSKKSPKNTSQHSVSTDDSFAIKDLNYSPRPSLSENKEINSNRKRLLSQERKPQLKRAKLSINKIKNFMDSISLADQEHLQTMMAKAIDASGISLSFSKNSLWSKNRCDMNETGDSSSSDGSNSNVKKLDILHDDLRDFDTADYD